MARDLDEPPTGLQGLWAFRAVNAVATLLLAVALVLQIVERFDDAPPGVTAVLVAGAVVAIVCNVLLLVEWAWRGRS